MLAKAEIALIWKLFQLTTAHALLLQEPEADEERIRSVLSGNLCRCTGYIPIVEAILEARAAYQAEKP